MFKDFFNTISFDEAFDSSGLPAPKFSKSDIIEILDDFDADEMQDVGEFIMGLVYQEEFDLDDDIDEAIYLDKKKSQVNREKKLNPSQKRKLAKQRKKWYKKNKNKSSVKLYRKKQAKKRKMGKTVGGNRIKTHR
jgi:hypothetical protein